MNTNHITSLHIRSVPVLDQDEALDFYTSHLGFEVRDDIDLGFMRWLTVGVPGQDTSVLLELVGGPLGGHRLDLLVERAVLGLQFLEQAGGMLVVHSGILVADRTTARNGCGGR